MTEPQTRTKYTYDSLYRLTLAVTAGSTNYPAWGLQWNYDKFGNRTAQSVYSGCPGSTCPTNSVTISTSTNQITGSPFSYDASGNMTNDGQNTLAYDGENRATSATNSSSSGAYVYDGKGLRIQKCVPNCTSPTTTTVYIFSNNKAIAEYDNGAAPTSPSREYIYAAGALVSKITSSATNYYHQDHLSNRLVTNTSGSTVEQMGHYPFGESWYNAASDKLLFTSYERDAESGNDYALARYYISRLGRFNSPDPVSGNPANPQSWNRYSYVLNDPINLNDPEGEYCQWDDGTDDDPPDAGGASQDECENQGGTWIDDAPDLGNGLGGDPGALLNSLLGTDQPAQPPGYEQCIIGALEEVLASGETPNEPNDGYGTLVGGTVQSVSNPTSEMLGAYVGMSGGANLDIAYLSLYQGNPRIFVQVHRGDKQSKWSSAFGRYQITSTLATQFNMTNWTPSGQDDAVGGMLQYYEAVQPAMAGDFQQAVWNMFKWASMPNATAPGAEITMTAAYQTFQDALNYLPECQ